MLLILLGAWLAIGVVTLLYEKMRMNAYNYGRDVAFPFLLSSVFLALFLDHILIRVVVCALIYMGLRSNV